MQDIENLQGDWDVSKLLSIQKIDSAKFCLSNHIWRYIGLEINNSIKS